MPSDAEEPTIDVDLDIFADEEVAREAGRMHELSQMEKFGLYEVIPVDQAVGGTRLRGRW